MHSRTARSSTIDELLKSILHAICAVALAGAWLTVTASAVDARFVPVHQAVVARRTSLTVRSTTVGNAVGVVLEFQSIEKAISAQFRTRRASVATAVDANLTGVFVKNAVRVHVARGTASTTIHPLLSQKWVVFIFTGHTDRKWDHTVHQLFPVVEDFVVAIFSDEVVVIQATCQREARQSDHKKDRQCEPKMKMETFERQRGSFDEAKDTTGTTLTPHFNQHHGQPRMEAFHSP